MITFVIVGFVGIVFVLIGMCMGDDGLPGVIIGAIMCIVALFGVNILHDIEEERKGQRPEGAWCTDAGGAYYANGSQDIKLQTQDGSAIVVAAPTCVYPEVP
jgi:hypothetical protein